MQRVVLLLSLIAGVGGCRAVAPYSTAVDASAPDRGTPPDMGTVELSTDPDAAHDLGDPSPADLTPADGLLPADVNPVDQAPLLDLPTPDVAPDDLETPPDTTPTPDTHPPDAAPTPDLTPSPDVRPADSAPLPDLLSPDQLAPDLLAPDLPWPADVGSPPDTGSTNACSSGTMVYNFSPTMVVCQHPSLVTQCQAPAVCNVAGGWHLCTATEYRARGGVTTPHSYDNGWIASCIRTSGTVHAPTNAICPGSCQGGFTWPPKTIGWTCGSGTADKVHTDPTIGVCMRSECRRLGANSASNNAYWTFALTNETHYLAVCCR
jgi:hypothetical protein